MNRNKIIGTITAVTAFIALIVFIFFMWGDNLVREDNMSENTSVRNLPDGTIEKYRLLAAEKITEFSLPVSMNSLYVAAIVEYINKYENKRR